MLGLQAMDKDYSPLEQEQVQSLLEIGDYLQRVRMDQGLTLAEVATETLIQVRLLKAIEAGKLRELPEPVYIQGFIRRYADFLGLDGAQVAAHFPIELDKRAVYPSWQSSPAAQLRPIHLYTAYILLITAAVSGLSYLMNRSTTWTPNGVGVTAPLQSVVPASPTIAAPTGQSPGAVASTPSLSDKPVRVEVTLTAQSWLRIDVDGKTEFQGILPEGTQKTWMANSQLKIRAGNAGAVLLAYNNGQAQPMGETGAVEERTFSVTQQSASLINP